MLPAASRYATALAVLRIYTGIFWLLHGYSKLTSAQWAVRGGEFISIVQGMIGGTSGPYHDFVVNVVLPNFGVFAMLVAWGETLTGISLLFGLFARLGGIGGAFLALNYWAAKSGYLHVDAYSGLDTAAIALSAINIALPTGLVAGVDGLIAARIRKPSVGGKS